MALPVPLCFLQHILLSLLGLVSLPISSFLWQTSHCSGTSNILVLLIQARLCFHSFIQLIASQGLCAQHLAYQITLTMEKIPQPLTPIPFMILKWKHMTDSARFQCLGWSLTPFLNYICMNFPLLHKLSFIIGAENSQGISFFSGNFVGCGLAPRASHPLFCLSYCFRNKP